MEGGRANSEGDPAATDSDELWGNVEPARSCSRTELGQQGTPPKIPRQLPTSVERMSHLCRRNDRISDIKNQRSIRQPVLRATCR